MQVFGVLRPEQFDDGLVDGDVNGEGLVIGAAVAVIGADTGAVTIFNIVIEDFCCLEFIIADLERRIIRAAAEGVGKGIIGIEIGSDQRTDPRTDRLILGNAGVGQCDVGRTFVYGKDSNGEGFIVGAAAAVIGADAGAVAIFNVVIEDFCCL